MVIVLLILQVLTDVALVFFLLKWRKIITTQNKNLDIIEGRFTKLIDDSNHDRKVMDTKLKEFEKATSKYVQSQVNGLEKKIYKEFDMHKKQSKNY